jgi:hypothetical protein
MNRPSDTPPATSDGIATRAEALGFRSLRHGEHLTWLRQGSRIELAAE